MKELLAGIIATVLSVFGGHQAVSDSASNAAAAVSVAPSAIVATSSAANPSFPGAEASSTIVYQTINQPIIERIVERTVQTAAPTGYVTQEAFTTAINELSDRFGRIISGSTYPAPASNFGSGGVWNAVALTNRIDHLSGTDLSDITVDGVSGLTDADIPDGITASNYLPLSGGSLAFASSTLFSVLNGAYFGATATSSFDSAGNLSLVSSGLTVGTNQLVVSGGNIGIGTTTPTQKLQVLGNIVAGDTALISNFASGVGISDFLAVLGSTDTDIPGIVLGNQSGTENKRFTLYHDTANDQIVFNNTFSSGGFSDYVFKTASSNLMTIKSTGNVGIGTTSPAALFSVAGNALISGTLTNRKSI